MSLKIVEIQSQDAFGVKIIKKINNHLDKKIYLLLKS